MKDSSLEFYSGSSIPPTRRQALKAAVACFTVGGGSPGITGSAAPPDPTPAVIVLDDCDPNFRGDVRTHDDGLRLLSADGKEIRRVGGLSNGQTIAMNHGIVTDPQRGRNLAGTGRTPRHRNGSAGRNPLASRAIQSNRDGRRSRQR